MIPLNPLAYSRFGYRVLSNYRRHHSNAGISLLQQTREIVTLLRLNRLEPHEYYEYEMQDGSLSWNEKTRFMSHHQASRFYTEVNPSFERGALNKLAAHKLYEAFKLPCPELYGFFDGSCGRSADGKSLRTLSELAGFLQNASFRKAVLKPLSSERGFGVKVIELETDGSITDVGVGRINVEELYDELISSRHNLNGLPHDTYLIEEFIRQHPYLDRFTDSCTQCLRIITYVNLAGEIEVLNTNIKIGEAGRVYDNTRSQGISAGIDPNGVLGPGVTVRNGRRVELETHPESGKTIRGAVIPHFADAIALARRAQAHFPQLRSIGWDIAVTENGPVIIEGNVTWSRHTQYYTRVGLITPSVRRELEMIV